VKSSPVTTPAAPMRLASSSVTKSSALVERGQPERRQVRLEKADGMGFEGGDDRGSPLVKSPLDRSPDHRLVAEMEAVEIAERDDASPQVVGDAAGEGQALH
jgi:hypothetical protein